MLDKSEKIERWSGWHDFLQSHFCFLFILVWYLSILTVYCSLSSSIEISSQWLVPCLTYHRLQVWNILEKICRWYFFSIHFAYTNSVSTNFSQIMVWSQRLQHRFLDINTLVIMHKKIKLPIVWEY